MLIRTQKAISSKCLFTPPLTGVKVAVMPINKRENRTYVVYLRVSTARQGQSGLGLEAQRENVANFVRRQDGTVLREFIEIESGRRNDRPRFGEALALAGRARATLLVAKLDRLSRNADFLNRIMQANVDFQAIDLPDANKLTIRIMAAVAEHEAEIISMRTKEALQAAKRRGQLLGSARPGHWAGREADRKRGAKAGAVSSAKVRTERTKVAYLDVLPTIRALRSEGASLAAIADHMNALSYPTRTDKKWKPTQVWRVLQSHENA